MKIDRTKLKKSSSEVPPDCQALIDKLKRCNWDTLLEELSQIKTWNCGECELYHWIDVLNEFDHILEVSCEKVKENQWCLTCDGLHKAKLKRLLLNVLQFTALLIEHSFSQHFYNSVEHLTTLLSSSDMNVVLAVLNLLYVFSKRSNFIARLNAEKRQPLLSHLSYLAESWGGKENGFGLAECCQNLLITDYPSSASTLHFEFSTDKAHKNSFNTVITIHIDNVDKIIHKTPSDIMNELVKNYAVPDDKQFQLFTQIRLAHSFSDYPKRILCVQARLQALSVLVYSNAVQDILNFLLYNGLIEELVDVLELQDSTLIEIKAAARRILTSIIRLDKNPKLSTITDTTGAVSYHGFPPVFDRNCIQAPTDYSQRSETSSCSAPPNYGTATAEDRDTGSAHSSPAATAFFIAFETEASTPRKKLGIRDSISKFAPTKSDAENRVSFQKNNKTEPSPKKLPIPDKANSSKSRTQFSANEKIDINEEIGKIADSTSFLIKRMLNGEMSPSDIPEEKPSKEKLHQNVQNDVNDDRSEAGTYIVETEQADCDVEEARKKIDEVFGVIQLSNSVLSSSYSSSTTSSSNKQIPRLNGRLQQNILKAPMNPKPRESTMQWNLVNKTYGRTRGQGPTPAASTESLNHSDTLPRSLQRTRKISDPPSTPDRTRRSKLATSPKSPGKAKTPSTLKSPGSLSNNLSAAPSNRETTNKDDKIDLAIKKLDKMRSEIQKEYDEVLKPLLKSLDNPKKDMSDKDVQTKLHTDDKNVATDIQYGVKVTSPPSTLPSWTDFSKTGVMAKNKDIQETVTHVPRVDSSRSLPMLDDTKYATLSATTSDTGGDGEHSSESGKHQKFEKKKVRRRMTQDRRSKLTVIGVQDTMVECQFESTEVKNITFKFDYTVTSPEEIANVVIKNLPAEIFTECIEQVIRQLKENPDKIPVILFLEPSTCACSPPTLRRQTIRDHLDLEKEPNRSWADRQWALCVFADVIEYVGSLTSRYQQYFLQPLIESLSSECPDIRQTAAYAMGCLGLYGGPEYRKVCADSVPALVKMINAPDSRSEDNIKATENAISAIAKFLMCNEPAISVEEIVPVWVSWLPIWEDAEESKFVYNFLCSLLETNNRTLLGNENCNLPHIVKIIAEAFYKEAIEPSSDVGKRVITLLRDIQNNQELFSACVAVLSPYQQEALHAALTNQ